MQGYEVELTSKTTKNDHKVYLCGESSSFGLVFRTDKRKKEAYQIAEKYGPKCKNLYVMRGQYCRDAIMNIPLQAGSMEYATFNDFEHVFVWVDDWTFDNMVKRKIITIIISTD